MIHIAFVTSLENINISKSDIPLVSHLKKIGFEIFASPWDDETIQWDHFDAIIFRSCWNYYEQYPRFLEWLSVLDHAHIPVFNPIETIRWNADKHYLKDLEIKKIPTIPTRWYKKNNDIKLTDIIRQTGWNDLVVKPTIGARSHGVTRIKNARGFLSQWKVNSLLKKTDIMVQPFIPEVTTHGEYSFVFIGGKYSHAVHKIPAKGNFLTNSYKSTITPFSPDLSLMKQITHIASRMTLDTLYMRIDAMMIQDILSVVEIECIEPILYFDMFPQTVEQFASALKKRLQ